MTMLALSRRPWRRSLPQPCSRGRSRSGLQLEELETRQVPTTMTVGHLAAIAHHALIASLRETVAVAIALAPVSVGDTSVALSSNPAPTITSTPAAATGNPVLAPLTTDTTAATRSSAVQL